METTRHSEVRCLLHRTARIERQSGRCRKGEVTLGYATAYAKPAYGLFTALFACESFQVLKESWSLTLHTAIQPTVEADHPLKMSGGHFQNNASHPETFSERPDLIFNELLVCLQSVL